MESILSRRVLAGALALFGSLGAMPIRAGCLAPYWLQVSSNAWAPDYLVTADVDGDGKPDILGNNGTTVFLARNDGTGHFGAPVTLYTGSIHGSIVAGDFNGDGNVDLAIAGNTALILLPGNGDGTFGAAIQSAVTISPAAIAAAPLDAGASLDLVAYDPVQNVLAAFTNDGLALFHESSRMTIGANAQAMVAADLDGDGKTDVVIAYANAGTFQAFYGHGDGTFDTAKVIWALNSTLVLQAADLDGDGLADLALASKYGVATIRNLGGRAFGDPLTYDRDGAVLNDLTVLDLTGDGHPDLLAASLCDLHTWTGTGIGTLGYSFSSSYYCSGYTVNRNAVAAADFDSDGRPDAALAFRPRGSSTTTVVNTYRNLCGDGVITLKTEAPTISTGQSALLNISVGPPASQIDQQWFLPTGDVTIREGVRAVGTLPLSSINSPLLFPVDGLPAGDHTLVASYSGDAQYTAIDSAPLVVHVTTATTTTSLSVNPPDGVFGAPVTLTANVASSTGDTPTGGFRFTIDGVVVNTYPVNGPNASVSGPSSVGSHPLTAAFIGDATHPPSSVTTLYVIAKQTPRLAISPASAPAGTPIGATLALQLRYGSFSATGTVTLTEGSTVYGTGTPSYLSVNLPALTAGRHDFRAGYSGDDHYNAVDTIVPFVVFPTAQSSIDARGTADSVSVTWYAPGLLTVSRKLPSQSWSQSLGMCCANAPWFDTYPAIETVYLYRMESYDHTTTSNIDVAMRIAFTDDPLLPGTTIKAAHMQEIVRATNILRKAAGLPDLTLNIQPGDVIAAAHVTTLRSSINEARGALGAYPFSFTGSIGAGLNIQATDIRELREAIR